MNRTDKSRVIRAPRGPQLSAKSWLTEAPLRMLMNNLDPALAERPEELVVYGGIGRAARDWASFDAIVATLKRLEANQTLLIQSGKPVGVFETHADAPRVLLANDPDDVLGPSVLELGAERHASRTQVGAKPVRASQDLLLRQLGLPPYELD